MKPCKRIYLPITVVAVLIMVVCELYAAFDVSTAEGVGLYFALKLNTQNRMIFDCLVLALDAVIMGLALVIPFKTGNNHTPQAFLRLMTIWFGVVPLIDYSELLGIIKDPAFGLFSNMKDYVVCYEKAITMLLVGCIIWYFLIRGENLAPIKKKAFVLIVVALALMVVSVFTYPEVGLLKWLIFYLFGVAFYILSEECIKAYVGLENYMWILNAMFFCMGLLMRITKTGHF